MALNLLGYCPFLIVMLIFLIGRSFLFSKNTWQGPAKAKFDLKAGLITQEQKDNITKWTITDWGVDDRRSFNGYDSETGVPAF